MSDDTDESRFHPSAWGRREGGGMWPPQGLDDEHGAWLVWLGEVLRRGGFTSFGQACRKLIKTDEAGRETPRRQLHVDQRTLTRWINGSALPQQKSFLVAMECLNEHIKEHRQSSPEVPGEVTGSEMDEGVRLLNAACAARDARQVPAQYAAEEVQRELDRVFEELGKVRAARLHLDGQVKAGRSFIALLEEIRCTVGAFHALQDDFDRVVRRVREGEDRLREMDIALENWQSRYDRLHAEYERAREAALEERLKMQDEISELRAALWRARQNPQEATAARNKVDDRLEGSHGLPHHRERKIERTARQLIELRDQPRDRNHLLRTVCSTWERESVYLLALRLGEEPEVGPGLARELTRRAGVRYYNPETEKPGPVRQWWADKTRVRLEPRTHPPRTHTVTGGAVWDGTLPH